MRDLLVIAVVMVSLPVAITRPFVGVLVWSWLGFMSPHRLGWGLASSHELSMFVALATLVGLILTNERRPVPRVRETYLLLAFWVMTLVSSYFAYNQEEVWESFNRLTKILVMLVVTIMLTQSRERLRTLLIVAAMSIGFYGVRGGIWALITGGEQGYALGPDGSFIGDNNGLALALDMTLPILLFLALEERGRLRVLLGMTAVLTFVTLPFTYSRGGALGLLVVLMMFAARSRWKWAVIPAGVLAAFVVVSFLPMRWFDRMNTIAAYTEDGSAMSRLHAWQIGWALAIDNPIVGGGYQVFPNRDIWIKYLPDMTWTKPQSAHSIYFQVLGEHGFVGFGLFIGVLVSTLLSLNAIRRRARRLPDGDWFRNYAYMVQTSILAFMAAGAFYNLAYFDLIYFLVAVTIIMKQLLADRLAAAPAPEPEPAEIGPLGVTR
jgi:probable O-glycosylation ligase (exosortase A-associated)